MSAWRSLRARWILRGGSFALNEGAYYPPSSYFIGFTGTNVASAHSRLGRNAMGAHDHADHHHTHAHDAKAEGELDGDGFYHAKCMAGPGLVAAAAAEGGVMHRLRAAAMAPEVGASGPNENDPPTGELCGNVFWALLNQRLRYLEPENETYVAEIERSILNVGLAALGQPGSGGEGPSGTGIRYFANQHKAKQNPSMHASCCEGQGSRLFGSLPKFIFSTVGTAGNTATIYVDLYTAATLAFSIVGSPASLTIDTRWPYAARVNLVLDLPVATSSLDLAVRIPAWLPGPVALSLDGAAWPTAGKPGSFAHITGPAAGWQAGTSVLSFDLAMAWDAALYAGSSRE